MFAQIIFSVVVVGFASIAVLGHLLLLQTMFAALPEADDAPELAPRRVAA